MKKISFFSLLLIIAIASCKKDQGNGLESTRANDPWVFRSVLDSMPRMVTLALNDNMWAAYHTDNCAVYKVWKGGVDFEGAVYNTQHGPQPLSVGDAWFENTFLQPWFLIQGGQEVKPKSVQYRGHRFIGEHVWLNYDLELPDGKIIRISERPEYVKTDDGRNGLERIFTTTNLPSGTEAGLRINVSSIVAKEMVETDGKWTIDQSSSRNKDNLASVDISGKLVLKSNGDTRFQTIFVKNPMIENPKNKLAIKEAEIPAGQAMINKYDCKTCHNEKVQTTGPAYVDVAKKYINTPENINTLVKKVINGGSGVWGQAAMTPHPNVPEKDIRTIVEYIMDLDKSDEKQNNTQSSIVLKAADPSKMKPSATNITEDKLAPGAWVQVYSFKTKLEKLADIKANVATVFEGPIPQIYATSQDLGGMDDNSAVIATGYMNIPKDNNYLFRLNSDDGSRLSIDNTVIITNDGLHNDETPMDGEVSLKKGLHSFKFEYFQAAGGKSLSLKWRSFDDKAFSIVPPEIFFHKRTAKDSNEENTLMAGNQSPIPGDGYSLQDVHPAYDLSQARPKDFLPKVAGMDFNKDGKLLVTTWDPSGSLYELDGVQTGDPLKIKVKQIAKGLAEPLGIKAVDGDIYVLQKQELTKLIDHDKDGIIDEYYTVCNGWKVSANFHEFAFGLAYKDGYLYATLATAILPGGASARPQIPDRGKVLKINAKDGSFEFIAQGLRTPNGIGIGVDNEIFVADNQGDWLPASKIVHVKPGAFYGSYSVDSVNQSKLPVTLPVVWLQQDEIGNSPSQPSYLNDGPYKGQMIHGDVTHGGVKRVFVEKVNGDYQGCVFRFIQGLEAGINRLVWGPDGALYVGGIGNPGNWSQAGKLWYGLQRLKYNGKSAFEMLAVRAKSNGMEIEFTEPLQEGDGFNPADYLVKQWWYKPTPNYGGPKMDEEKLTVVSSSVSADRKKVFLELKGMKPGHIIYIRLMNHFISSLNHDLWTTESWYTLNQIPQNQPGSVSSVKYVAPAPNTLSAAEAKAGWQLLFDGKSLAGWRNYGKKTLGTSWKVLDNAISLTVEKGSDGTFQSKDGGDIITDKEYENYELTLEWKISPCGNSGIIYNVIEDTSKYHYVWNTGPEMQVLDNTCHPDGKIKKHRAGDLYDLISCKFETVKPAGQWNKIRLVVKKGHLEHWLNGYKVVDTQMWDDNWKKMIAGSKFKDMPGFGTGRKGHIALQDHGNVVSFRNIKLLPL